MASIYYRDQGVWVEAVTVYKKVNGTWVEQLDLSNVLEDDTRYIDKDSLSYLADETGDVLIIGADKILV